MNNCLFCKIIAREIPAEIVYEDDHSLAFLDIKPINKGHTLVIPKTHFENVFDIDEKTMESLYTSVRDVAQAVKSATDADGLNINNNNGEAAGQEIFHYHVHLIPRFENDRLKHWPGKEYEKGEAEKIAEDVRLSLKD